MKFIFRMALELFCLALSFFAVYVFGLAFVIFVTLDFSLFMVAPDPFGRFCISVFGIPLYIAARSAIK